MSSRKRKGTSRPASQSPPRSKATIPPKNKDPLTQPPPWLSLKVQLIVCVLIAIGLYANTLGHKYALDDGLVIYENPNTRRGIEGLPGIFTSDAYAFYYKQFGQQEGELAGGRYRPLSIATFALEWELFGIDSGFTTTYTTPDHKTYPATVTGFEASSAVVQFTDSTGQQLSGRLLTTEVLEETAHPAISHAVNVLLFALTVAFIVILFRKYIFTKRPLLAFLSAFIFTIHPIHTEVVANIKSRDEILSLLFLVLTLIYVFRYIRVRHTPSMIWACVFYFLALLSKENGITFLAVIPLTLFCFRKLKLNEIVALTLPFVAIGALFVLIRVIVVGLGGEGAQGVMNDPFYLAEAGQKLPTIFVTLLEYVKLLFIPHPLSFDYGYYHFGYVGFGHPVAALSLLLHLGLLVAGLLGIRRKKVWAYGILFYLITLSIVSNVVFLIGASMGERLIYLPSLGFAIAMAALIEWAIKRLSAVRGKTESRPVVMTSIQASPIIMVLILLPLLLAAGYKTVTRNMDWKDNTTLFITDASKVPNSIKANVSAATQYIDLADKAATKEGRDSLLHRAIPHLQKAITIQNEGGIPFVEHFTDVYINLGGVYHRMDMFTEAADNYLKVGEGNSWFKLNEAFIVVAMENAADEATRQGEFQQAVKYLTRALYYRPNDVNLNYKIGGAYYQAGDIAKARAAYEKSVNLAPDNALIWYNLGGFYFTIRDYPNAVAAFQKCLALQPENVEAQQGLAAAQAAVGR